MLVSDSEQKSNIVFKEKVSEVILLVLSTDKLLSNSMKDKEEKGFILNYLKEKDVYKVDNRVVLVEVVNIVVYKKGNKKRGI